MSFNERQSQLAVDHIAVQPMGHLCPFCGACADAQVCGSCGRDTTASRRPCAKCRRMVPSSDRSCWNCGAVFKSDLRWKIPLIVFLFLLAFVISILLAFFK
jgi:hypothetical protein